MVYHTHLSMYWCLLWLSFGIIDKLCQHLKRKENLLEHLWGQQQQERGAEEREKTGWLTLKMLLKSRPGSPSCTSFLKKFKQATMALPWRREERTRLRVLGRMCSFTVTMEPGLTSITVQSKVSTNWEMWRSLSLIRAGSSAKAVL